MAERGTHPVDWLRGLALSLERLAAQGVASGAVRGATQEIRAGVPEDLDVQLRALIQDALTVVGRLVGEAAKTRTSPLESWSRTAAEGAVRGAIEETRRLVPEMRPMNQELFARLKLWLDHSQTESAARTQAIHSPGEIARTAAQGAVAGVTDQLSAALPALATPAAEFASRVGRGAVRGVAEELGQQARELGRRTRVAARSPVGRAVFACGAALTALAAVLVVARRGSARRPTGFLQGWASRRS
jgi:hypothetical protein